MAEPTVADLDRALDSTYWQANGPGWVLRWDKDQWTFNRTNAGAFQPGLAEFLAALPASPGGPSLEWIPLAEETARDVFGEPAVFTTNFHELPDVEGVVY